MCCCCFNAIQLKQTASWLISCSSAVSLFIETPNEAKWIFARFTNAVETLFFLCPQLFLRAGESPSFQATRRMPWNRCILILEPCWRHYTVNRAHHFIPCELIAPFLQTSLHLHFTSKPRNKNLFSPKTC